MSKVDERLLPHAPQPYFRIDQLDAACFHLATCDACGAINDGHVKAKSNQCLGQVISQ